MKKKIYCTCLIIILILLVLCLIYLFLPQESVTYSNDSITLEIPKLSILIEERKEHNFEAKNIRTTFALEIDMKKIIEKLDKISCDNKDFYYNEEEDYTILRYGITKGFVLNTVWLDYEAGNYCKKYYEEGE